MGNVPWENVQGEYVQMLCITTSITAGAHIPAEIIQF